MKGRAVEERGGGARSGSDQCGLTLAKSFLPAQRTCTHAPHPPSLARPDASQEEDWGGREEGVCYSSPPHTPTRPFSAGQIDRVCVLAGPPRVARNVRAAHDVCRVPPLPPRPPTSLSSFILPLYVTNDVQHQAVASYACPCCALHLVLYLPLAALLTACSNLSHLPHPSTLSLFNG